MGESRAIKTKEKNRIQIIFKSIENGTKMKYR